MGVFTALCMIGEAEDSDSEYKGRRITEGGERAGTEKCQLVSLLVNTNS